MFMHWLTLPMCSIHLLAPTMSDDRQVHVVKQCGRDRYCSPLRCNALNMAVPGWLERSSPTKLCTFVKARPAWRRVSSQGEHDADNNEHTSVRAHSLLSSARTQGGDWEGKGKRALAIKPRLPHGQTQRHLRRTSHPFRS